jgi:hypothetical protein
MRKWLALLLLLPGCKPSSDDWNHKQLLEHFAEHQLHFHIADSSVNRKDGPARWFYLREASHNPQAWDAALQNRTVASLEGVVFVQRCATAQIAKEKAAQPGNVFSYGVWFFEGPPNLLKKMEAALN